VNDLESHEIFISQDVMFHEDIFPYEGTELEHFAKCINILGPELHLIFSMIWMCWIMAQINFSPQPSLATEGAHEVQNNSSLVL